MQPGRSSQSEHLRLLWVGAAVGGCRPLAPPGWELSQVAGVAEALGLKGEPPDAVVLASEELRREDREHLRALCGHFPRAVLLAVSGEQDPSRLGRALEAGALECLHPHSLDPQALGRAVVLGRERKRLWQELSRERRLYRSIVETQSELVCRFLPGGMITFANRAFRQYFAGDRRLPAGLNLFELVVEDYRQQLQEQLSHLEADQPVARVQLQVWGQHGDKRWQRWVMRVLFDEGDRTGQYQVVAQDVTAAKQLEQWLQAAEANLRHLLMNNADGMVVTDLDARVLFVNPAAEELLGRRAGDLLGQTLELELVPGSRSCLCLPRGDGSEVSVDLQVVEVRWQHRPARLATLRDVTELVRLQEELRALSLEDELTGLYNRRGFLTLGRQQLKTAQRMGRRMYLYFMDLDGLKVINDQLGHAQGDQAIREAAMVLKATFRESDIMARLGGDEFAVLAMESGPECNRVILRRLEENLRAWNQDTKRPYRLDLSMGSATFDPQAPRTLEDLLAEADAEMYRHKRRHRTRGEALSVS